MANSTITFTGYNPDSRNSSKVLRPPGGGSSDIFGPPQDEDDKAVRKESKTRSDIFGLNDKENETKVENGDKKDRLASSFQLGDQQPEETEMKPKRKSIDPLSGQVLGEKDSPVKEVPPQPKTSGRIPPGGHSSGLW